MKAEKSEKGEYIEDGCRREYVLISVLTSATRCPVDSLFMFIEQVFSQTYSQAYSPTDQH